MSLQKSHPVRTLLWSGHELTVKSIISCEAKCHAKANGKDDEKLHFEPKVSVFWKCLLTTGIKLYILLPFIELPIHHTHTYIIHYLLVNIKGNTVLAHISPFLKAHMYFPLFRGSYLPQYFGFRGPYLPQYSKFCLQGIISPPKNYAQGATFPPK